VTLQHKPQAYTSLKIVIISLLIYAGQDETQNDCLKSLMATYLYRQMVDNYTKEGVNFKDHLYIPEIDPRTNEYFHEREDHNHVLKRITNCTRNGDVPDVDVRAFVEALHDPNTGLTYTALTGQHKQSVPDCERVFSRGVIEFMERNGHTSTARFVRVVHNWHKASDGRGLTEETRKQYNLEMLDYLLEDWMPWYESNRDYSTMDVNRYALFQLVMFCLKRNVIFFYLCSGSDLSSSIIISYYFQTRHLMVQ